MKKIIFPFAVLMAICFSATAQNHKPELVSKIEEKHNWLYAYAVDKTVTANLSESMWQLVLGENKNPKGYSTFKLMGKAFCDLSDKFGETYLEKKCGFGVNSVDEKDNREGCQSAMDAWGGKYAITINAAGIPAGNDAYKMVTGYVSSVATYVGDGSGSLWHHGYQPKGSKLHIVINADNKYKAVAVSWNTDGSVVTINAPGDIETAGWDSKIEKGIQAGWKLM